MTRKEEKTRTIYTVRKAVGTAGKGRAQTHANNTQEAKLKVTNRDQEPRKITRDTEMQT